MVLGFFGPKRSPHVITVLREALALGVNHIDNSGFMHVTNQIIREGFIRIDDLTIVTKLVRGVEDDPVTPFSPAELQSGTR